jgi:hypothetical protein
MYEVHIRRPLRPDSHYALETYDAPVIAVEGDAIHFNPGPHEFLDATRPAAVRPLRFATREAAERVVETWLRVYSPAADGVKIVEAD